MENLNFEHGKKWKYTDLGIRLHGSIGQEFVIPPLSPEDEAKVIEAFYDLYFQPNLKIIHKPDGIYDAYNTDLNKWLFSFSSADNVFVELSKYGFVHIEFIDEVYP